MQVELEESRKTGAILTKLTGMSRNVAAAVIQLLLGELGLKNLGKGEFDPASENPDVDHSKLAENLFVSK